MNTDYRDFLLWNERKERWEMNVDYSYDIRRPNQMDSAGIPMGMQSGPSLSQAKRQVEPSMKEQLAARRAQLLIELRDIEQALEQMDANPNFEAVMRTIIKAHRY